MTISNLTQACHSNLRISCLIIYKFSEVQPEILCPNWHSKRANHTAREDTSSFIQLPFHAFNKHLIQFFMCNERKKKQTWTQSLWNIYLNRAFSLTLLNLYLGVNLCCWVIHKFGKYLEANITTLQNHPVQSKEWPKISTESSDVISWFIACSQEIITIIYNSIALCTYSLTLSCFAITKHLTDIGKYFFSFH